MEVETAPPRVLEGLNREQLEAVTAPIGNSLVLAGAGSGKTSVLTRRIVWLLREQGLPFEAILAVTFTNKAAKEIRERIEALLGHSAGGIWIGTFHGLCHRMLRHHHEEAGLPDNFQIIDSEDSKRLIKRAIEQLDLDSESWPPKKAAYLIDHWKGAGLRPDKVAPANAPEQRYLDIYKSYETLCRQNNCIDFNELLLRAVELLKTANGRAIELYRARFRQILVDEFQDTNSVQYEWLRLLNRDGGASVFVVGDDDQSIYGWRGARVENMEHFVKDFPDVERILLARNYRSSSNILRVANTLIENNTGRMGKDLWTEAGAGDMIVNYTAYNEADEVQFILSQASAWQRAGGQLSDCAVLYRSNYLSRSIEMACIAAQVPYRVYGGRRFFDRAEIRDAVAYLRMIANPDDNVAFERVVNLPTRRVGQRSIEKLRHLAAARHTSLWQVAAAPVEGSEDLDAPLQGERISPGIGDFVRLVQRLQAMREEMPLNELAAQAVALSGLKEHHGKDRDEMAQGRVENLDELMVAVEKFREELEAEDSEVNPLAEFLNGVALDAGDREEGSAGDALQLMTLHAAKGLEFPVVFITAMEQGIFPNNRALDEGFHGLEEERRLCYVGFTRARRKLYLTAAGFRSSFGRDGRNPISQFIDELQPAKDLLRRESPRFSHSSIAASARSPRLAAYVSHRHKTPTSVEGMSLGSRVCHQSFGEGTVLQFEGDGDATRVQINFDDSGDKWLVLSYANLSPVA